MPFRLKIRHLALLAAALPVLASCNSNKNPLEVTVQRCPAIAVVGGAGSLTRFVGDGRDAGDILYKATISDVRLECEQDGDVISRVSFTVVGQRGPAMRGAETFILPYFVVVLRDNSEIVAKDIYDLKLGFGANDERAARQEVLRQVLPTIEQARRYDYEILIGFQLDPEDVTYNLVR